MVFLFLLLFLSLLRVYINNDNVVVGTIAADAIFVVVCVRI